MSSIRRLTLPNGMKVLLAPDDRAPVVAFHTWVRVGSADEKDEEAGLAHVLEHMLFKGTERRGVGEIAQEIEGCGGDINAFTSFDTTVYHVMVASRFFDQGLDVLADAVQSSVIDAEELTLEKEVILEEIKRGEDSPGNRLGHALFSKAFTKHNYRRPVIGRRKTVAGADRDTVYGFYKKHYYPANMVFVAAGDFDPKEAARCIRKAFKGGRRRKPRAQRRPREPKQTQLRRAAVNHDTSEFYFDLAFHIPGMSHDDVAALDLLSVALGLGNLSRLGWRLRRTDQLANSIHAYAYTPRDPGLFLVSGTCPPDRREATIQAALDEVFRLYDGGIREDELQRARTTIEGEAVYERETVQGIARKLGFYETVGGDLGLEKRYYQRIASATAEDVDRVVRTYLTPENLTIGTLDPEGQKAIPVRDLRKWVRKAQAAATPSKKRRRSTCREQKVELPGGATLVMRADPQIPIVSLRSVFLGGLRLETEESNGLSNLVARLHGKGTGRRSYSEILRQVDGYAGQLSGFAGYNSFGLRMDFLSRHLPDALELFTDSLLDPVFDQRELEVERRQVLEAIKSVEDHLSSYVMRLFTETLYDEHPYHMSLLGTADRVAEYTREDLAAFYGQRALPDNMVLAAVGDFDPGRLEGLLARHLEGWSSEGGFQPPDVPQDRAPEAPRHCTVNKPREQAHLVVGFRGVTLTDERRHALELLSSVLAGQGGRLFFELRDREGLAYTVTAFSQEALDPGYFAIYIATDPGKLQRAMDGIQREVNRVKTEGISSDELERNARQLVGSYEIDLQRAAARAASLAFNERYGLGYDYYRRYPREILAVTADDVVEAARDFLDFDRAVWAIIRPEGAAAEAA